MLVVTLVDDADAEELDSLCWLYSFCSGWDKRGVKVRSKRSKEKEKQREREGRRKRSKEAKKQRSKEAKEKR